MADPQGVALALFHKAMVSSPSVCTKAGGVFVSPIHVVKFELPVRESRTPSSEGSSEAPRH
jgi:hypothetical protein